MYFEKFLLFKCSKVGKSVKKECDTVGFFESFYLVIMFIMWVLDEIKYRVLQL